MKVLLLLFWTWAELCRCPLLRCLKGNTEAKILREAGLVLAQSDDADKRRTQNAKIWGWNEMCSNWVLVT